MKKSRTSKKKTAKLSKNMIIGITAAAVVVVGLLYFTVFHNGSDQNSPPTTLVTADGKKVNLNPPTPSQEQANNSSKDAIVNQDVQNNQSNPNASGTQVSVTITQATTTGVRAYVSGVFEDGGTCTATATQPGSPTVSQTSAGFENVSTTQCTPIDWQLGPGTWSVTVSYKSANAQGSSKATPTTM